MLHHNECHECCQHVFCVQSVGEEFVIRVGGVVVGVEGVWCVCIFPGSRWCLWRPGGEGSAECSAQQKVRSAAKTIVVRILICLEPLVICCVPHILPVFLHCDAWCQALFHVVSCKSWTVQALHITLVMPVHLNHGCAVHMEQTTLYLLVCLHPGTPEIMFSS